MSEQTGTVKGRVIDPETKTGYGGATVRLQFKPDPEKEGESPGEPQFGNTDVNGRFTFSETAGRPWKTGSYALWAYHTDSKQGEERTLALEPGKSVRVNIEMVPDKEIRGYAGVGLTVGLIIALAVLVCGYVWLHSVPREEPEPLDHDLTALVKLARNQVEYLPDKKAAEAAEEQAQQATELEASSPISATIATVETLFETLRNEPDETLFSTQKEQAIAGLLSQTRAMIARNDKAQLNVVLEALDDATVRPTGWFWQYPPWRFAEVTMWALFATMSRVAFDTSKEVLLRRFRYRAVLERVVLCLTVPALALVMTFLLSLVGVKIAFGENELSLDVTNVTVAIVIATMVGLLPWQTWDLLERLSNRLFDTLRGLSRPKEEPEPEREEEPTKDAGAPVEAATELEDEQEPRSSEAPPSSVPDQERRFLRED